MPGFLRNRWWVVFASVCGLLVGSGAINIFAFGVFLKPVTEDLGIGRGMFASGLFAGSVMVAIAYPLLGYVLDRWGVRRVMMIGVIIYAATVASHALLTPSPVVIYLVFAFAGTFGCIGSPVPYGVVITRWFDRQRGLAMGIATAGVGLGVAIVPQVAAVLIPMLGWRMAYVGLTAFVFLVAWLPVALFIREPSTADAVKQPDIAAERDLPGLTVWQAVTTSWRFWALTIAFVLAVAAINGTLTHIVALLTDRGIPLGVATLALSASGIALLVGRIISGWCLDRFFGPWVAVGFFLVPMAGIACLASGVGGSVPIIGAILCGIGIGAEIDLMAFFVSRYFGLKSYGRVYGTMFAAFTVATSGGPFIAGAIFDHYRSYAPAFLLFEGFLVVTCLLLLPLGAYPYPAHRRVAAANVRRAVA